MNSQKHNFLKDYVSIKRFDLIIEWLQGGSIPPTITNPTGAGLIAPIIYLIFYQMALNWNLENVENYKELFTEGDEQGYSKMILIYERILFMTIQVGIRHISENNWQKFYNRVYLLERVDGAGYYSTLKLLDGTEKMQPIYITEDDVKRMIGLRTNASEFSKTQFLKKLTSYFEI